MKQWWIMLIMLTTMFAAQSEQEVSASVIITRAKIIDGDTIPHVTLPEIRTYARRKWKNKQAQARYTRLVYNIQKVLPIARQAALRLEEIQANLAKIDGAKERKTYIEKMEKKLFAEFEQKLKKLTITQGKILIKLIDRETGDTSYELIRALKGRFSAFMWQGVARMFGSNLKSTYDALGDDKTIERIIQLIDDGVYDDYFIE